MLIAAALLAASCTGTTQPDEFISTVVPPTSEPSSTAIVAELTETPDPTATPEPNNTPQATVSPELTETPEATATTEPTSTPEATSTAAPTETPVVVATAEPTGTPDASTTSGELTTVVSDENSLIVNINGAVDSQCDVQAEYWNDDIGPFLTEPIPSSNESFEIQVMRLRAETEYDFEVSCVNSGEDSVIQHEGSFTTGPLPAGLEGATFDLIEGRPTYGLTLMDFNDRDFKGIVAIDQDAEVVWYYEHSHPVFALTQRNNHNLAFNLNLLLDPSAPEAPGDMGMAEITPDGQMVHQMEDVLDDGTTCSPYRRWHHEMLERPDDVVWTMGWEIRPVDIEGVERFQTGDTIEQWDKKTGTVTRLFSLFDAFDPVHDRTSASDVGTHQSFFWAGCNNEYTEQTEDWTHANSLWLMNDDKVLMSIRHLDQVIAIEADFSGVAWRLGGPNSDFSFPDSSDRFFHQHSAVQLPNGNILLFDNGNTRPDANGGEYSRALELELDFDTMDARKVWEYRHDPELFANCCSNVTRLENGNTLIVFGADEGRDPPVFTIVEANPEGEAVATTEVISPGKLVQYRVYPLDTINGETEN
jgi:hypothetical protein